jgi:hypothetical protein
VISYPYPKVRKRRFSSATSSPRVITQEKAFAPPELGYR